MVEEVKKTQEKKEEKVVKTSKKKDAVVNGNSVGISTKHSIAICNFIRGKNVDKAIEELEKVSKYKVAIPMTGEIPHRKGKIMSGRFPINASKEFIRLLKSVKANAIANELELENLKIVCKANVASRPYRRFGKTKFKRTNVEIKLIESKK